MSFMYFGNFVTWIWHLCNITQLSLTFLQYFECCVCIFYVDWKNLLIMLLQLKCFKFKLIFKTNLLILDWREKKIMRWLLVTNLCGFFLINSLPDENIAYSLPYNCKVLSFQSITYRIVWCLPVWCSGGAGSCGDWGGELVKLAVVGLKYCIRCDQW